MTRLTSEFDLDDRSEVELLRNFVDDSQDQLRRARQRLDRAQRRVKNLEVAYESWTVLLAQYERALEQGRDRAHPNGIRV